MEGGCAVRSRAVSGINSYDRYYKHLVHEAIIVARIVARVDMFEPIPVLGKDLFEEAPGRWSGSSHQAVSRRSMGCLW